MGGQRGEGREGKGGREREGGDLSTNHVNYHYLTQVPQALAVFLDFPKYVSWRKWGKKKGVICISQGDRVGEGRDLSADHVKKKNACALKTPRGVAPPFIYGVECILHGWSLLHHTASLIHP